MNTHAKSVSWGLLVVLINAAIFASQAFAGTWYVDSHRSASGDGTGWATAFVTIQEAISNDNVQSGDEIWVKAGTYSLSNEIIVNKAVGVYGGFNGSEVLRNQRDWIANRTIVDGQSLVDHCFNISADCTIDGFEITGGYSDGGGTSYFGGGLIAIDSAPLISNCIFEDNFAQMGGAGLDTWKSTPTISGCTFRRNRSVSGGAIRFRESNVTIINCLFENNVSEGADSRGGGIYAWDTSITVTNTSFLDNTATGSGGGFMSINGDAIFQGCTFSGNQATTNGGAISSRNCDVVIDNCTFNENSSNWNGGAIINEELTLTISNSRFFDNYALHFGGAVYNSMGDFSMVNCAVYSNRVDSYGGGLYIDNSSLTVTNCTFSENVAGPEGAGITLSNSTAGQIINSILWGNTSNSGDAEIFDFSGASAVVVQYSNVDQDQYEGINGNIRVEPQFVAPESDDFRLSPGSDCIDAGTSDNAPGNDLNGLSRPQGTGHDIGAYEWTADVDPPTVVSAVGSANQVVVTFNEPLNQASATIAGNYSINNGISILGIDTDDASPIVTLSTSAHSEGSYALTISGVRDLADNAMPMQTVAYTIAPLPQVETCNGLDDDNDGEIDEGVQTTYYRDTDGDGYGDAQNTTQACSAPGGHVTVAGDCDDTSEHVHPEAEEVCNGLDDDCDGDVDEGVGNTYYRDADGDGYGDAQNTTQACSAPEGYLSEAGDCDDTNADIHPEAEEVCNGLDDDCNGDADDDCIDENPRAASSPGASSGCFIQGLNARKS